VSVRNVRDATIKTDRAEKAMRKSQVFPKKEVFSCIFFGFRSFLTIAMRENHTKSSSSLERQRTIVEQTAWVELCEML
jgi:hypothetical protein